MASHSPPLSASPPPRVNITVAARLTGRSEKTIRLWLAESPCPLSVEWGQFRGGRRHEKSGKVIKGRTRLLDVDELRALHEQHGGTEWHAQYLPRPNVGDLRHRIEGQDRRIEELEAQVRALRGEKRHHDSLPQSWVTPPTDRVQPPSAALPPRDGAEDLPIYHTAPTVPVARKHASPKPSAVPRDTTTAAWASGRRGHELYSQYWTLDSALAKEGLLLFQTWGRMCGVRSGTVDSHRRRQADGKMPADLSFTDREYLPGLTLRYVNAVQRGAWLAYWQKLGHVTQAPTEADVQDALDELASWT